MTPITAIEFARLEDLDNWRFVLGRIRTQFACGSYAAATQLVAAIGAVADVAHHADITVRPPGDVGIALRTRDADALTTLDVDLARTISALAGAAGAIANPTSVQAVEIAIDTMDADRIRPFWAAVLGYAETGRTEVSDPARVGPPVWFQQMDEPRTERQRFHLDVSVPHDVAKARVAAALAAGGTLVSDAHARAWWVLADADGNEACISTWQDRG